MPPQPDTRNVRNIGDPSYIPNGSDFGASNTGTTPLPLSPDVDVLIDNLLNATQHTFTVTGRNGNTWSRRVTAFGFVVIRGAGISSIVINTADSGCKWQYGLAGEFDGIIGVGNVGVIGSSASVGVLDAGANRTIAPMTNGGVAPADGVVWVTLAATATDAITLSDGTNTKNVVASASGIWQLVQFHVLQGTTYTLAGTGLVILGTGMFVGVG